MSGDITTMPGAGAEVRIPPSLRGDPVWALATLFPTQGEWTEDDYFQLETRHFIELTDGCIEILPMPTWLHQRIVAFLYEQFASWCASHRRGEALFAPLPLRLFSGTIREPDLLVVERPAAGAPGSENARQKYPSSAILVVEVVSDSPESRQRDFLDKRRDYARAEIPEYWIVDPDQRLITVLTLAGTQYLEHGRFGGGTAATSRVLNQFSVRTDDVWALCSNH